MKRSMLAKVKLRDNKNVVIYYRNRRWPTGISVDDPKHFDEDEGLLNSKYGNDYGKLNLYISEKLQFYNKLILEAAKQNLDTLDYLNAHFDEENKKLKKLKITNNTFLVDAFEEYLLAKKDKFKDFKKDRSLQRYESELSRLRDYHQVNPTKISNMNLNWFLDFSRWLSKPYQKTYKVIDTKNEREYFTTKEFKQTNSTIKRFIQDLISFFTFMKTGHPEVNFPFVEIRKFMYSLKSPKNDPDSIIALNDIQYEAIMNYNAREDRPWEIKTIDLFKFCISTGLRYSDAVNLNDIHIRAGNIIDTKAVKTTCRFVVPMNATALEIFDKYGRDFRGKFPVNQQINDNLRKIFKQIPEFNTFCKSYDYVLGNVIEVKIKGYDLITFHASRRTFVSRAIRRNATLTQIKKWTGWTDLRTLKHYLDVFGNNHEDDMAILN